MPGETRDALRAGRPVSPADVLLSAGLFALLVPHAYSSHRSDFGLILALGAVNVIVLLGRKRWPLGTLAAVLVLAGTLAEIMRHSFPVTPTTLIALYATGRYTTRWIALPAVAVTAIIGVVVAHLSHRIPAYGSRDLAELGWVFFAGLAGAWVRTQRAYVAAAEQRLARAATEREEEARRRVSEERVRIARELHDVVGHALMSISVQSSVGAKVVLGNPAAGRTALRTISEISGSALGEIRSTLTLLRDGESPTHPSHGLADLGDLIAQAALPVTYTRTGPDADMPAIVGLTVYRIVQESLTNVARHGHDVTQVRVNLAVAPRELTLTITDDGTPSPAGDGLGLRGMRERAAILGGRVDAGPITGGFRVHARLPLEAP